MEVFQENINYIFSLYAYSVIGNFPPILFMSYVWKEFKVLILNIFLKHSMVHASLVENSFQDIGSGTKKDKI